LHVVTYREHSAAAVQNSGEQLLIALQSAPGHGQLGLKLAVQGVAFLWPRHFHDQYPALGSGC
jgi:hypothetical protein